MCCAMCAHGRDGGGTINGRCVGFGGGCEVDCTVNAVSGPELANGRLRKAEDLRDVARRSSTLRQWGAR